MRDLSKGELSEGRYKTSLVSKNITVQGRRTSIRLEPEMWMALRDIAMREKCSIHDICSLVSMRKSQSTSLTAAIRVFLMLYYRAAATDEGHKRAGHGNFEQMQKRARVVLDSPILPEKKSDDQLQKVAQI
ncbi:MAG: ribbon-helix-helix domain-containing protein [Alphaproteobacteria bacterium]